MRALALVVVAAGIVFAGCERSRDHAVEKVVEAAIAAHGRSAAVAIDRQQGSIRVTLGQARVPAGWPPAVPVYENATKAKIEDPGPDRQRVSVTTDDSPTEIGEFYRRTLSEAGWRLQIDADASEWSGERGREHIRLRVVPRDSIAGGSRAEIEYRSGGGKG